MQRQPRIIWIGFAVLVGLALGVALLYALGAPRSPQEVVRPVELELMPS